MTTFVLNGRPTDVAVDEMTPVGPAIANAVAALTGGARLRQLPFTPDRVKAALTRI
jgi:hypothetical protein